MLDTAANPERITSSALGLEPRVQYILLGFITIETFSYINVEPSSVLLIVLWKVKLNCNKNVLKYLYFDEKKYQKKMINYKITRKETHRSL